MFKTDNTKATVTVVQGGVLDWTVDAIVNAANSSLLGGGGVDGAIHRAAGPKLVMECMKLHGCRAGEAKITGAYNIKTAKYIIHTVGPYYRNRPNDPETLASCYRNSLDLALANNCQSIAFPCISTGVYSYPIEDAAEIVLKTVGEWLEAHPESDIRIMFCCFKPNEYEVYEQLFNS